MTCRLCKKRPATLNGGGKLKLCRECKRLRRNARMTPAAKKWLEGWCRFMTPERFLELKG